MGGDVRNETPGESRNHAKNKLKPRQKKGGGALRDVNRSYVCTSTGRVLKGGGACLNTGECSKNGGRQIHGVRNQSSTNLDERLVGPSQILVSPYFDIPHKNFAGVKIKKTVHSNEDLTIKR